MTPVRVLADIDLKMLLKMTLINIDAYCSRCL